MNLHTKLIFLNHRQAAHPELQTRMCRLLLFGTVPPIAEDKIGKP